ncbi:MAG: SDR family NAD(P)-dependent oxidoreductase, partial [Opitutales bacterium]|nr:SDR family NAD(P)-dependent oxidoreductase [Opitutales bacterium]
MRILVTGGAGYIGTHTVIELLQAGYDITIVDNLYNSQEGAVKRGAELAGKTPEFHKVDLLDYAALEEVFKTHKFDAVIHFAGLKAVGESVAKPLFYYHNNMTGTFNLLDLMKKYGCRNIVFSSSATVYGMPEKVPLDESCSTGALNPYGATKLFLERVISDVKAAEPDLGVVLLRYFNPVGA